MKKYFQKHTIISFFILTFIISWFCWLPLFLVKPPQGVSTLLIMIGGFGPMLSAVLITSTLKRGVKKWLRSIYVFKLKPKEYGLAIFIPLLIGLLIFVLFELISSSASKYPHLLSFLNYPLMVLVVALIGGGQEEPGWRGFALPELLKKRTPLMASIIIGIFWSFWHLPLFLSPNAIQHALPFGWYIINTIAFSMILTKVYSRTNSVIPVMIAHGGINALGNFVPADISSVYPYVAISSILVALWIFFLNPTKKHHEANLQK